jgi:hypothetical protein
MNAKEIIEKLREQFNEMIKPTNEIKLMDATLVDGSVVQITEMIVGGVVTMNGIPAPVGEYTLADGNIIVVSDNGAITEIKSAMPEEPPMMEDMGAKFSAFEVTTNEKFASYETKFSAYESKFADYEAKLSKAYGLIDGLISLSKTLAETPTGKPDEAVAKQNNFKEEKKMSYDILFS